MNAKFYEISKSRIENHEDKGDYLPAGLVLVPLH